MLKPDQVPAHQRPNANALPKRSLTRSPAVKPFEEVTTHIKSTANTTKNSIALPSPKRNGSIVPGRPPALVTRKKSTHVGQQVRGEHNALQKGHRFLPTSMI